METKGFQPVDDLVEEIRGTTEWLKEWLIRILPIICFIVLIVLVILKNP